MPAAARVGDAIAYLPNPGPVPAPVGQGTLGLPGAPTVLIGGRPAATAGSLCAYVVPPPGSPVPPPPVPVVPLPLPRPVLIGGMPAVVKGSVAGPGTVTGGCPTVMIGG